MSEINEATVFSLAPNASFQALGEGAVILLIDSGQLYTCNETTEAFLKRVDGQRNFGAILSLLMAEFAVDRETLGHDFLLIADQLRSEGIVEISPGSE
jgi:pyrroloquinoline quinone biosynthesis protein D